MNESDGPVEDWITAGKITAEALDLGRKIIKPGKKLLEVAEEVEEYIIKQGASPGFPANISLNHVSAHDTPTHNDERVFSDNDLVKLDVGVSFKGAIGDSAITVDLSGKQQKLLEASKKALQNVSEKLKAGITYGEVGKIIEDTIQEEGFEPVRNLGGHSLARYEVHAGKNIPNYDNKDIDVLNEGDIIAIEPFATDGSGLITESENVEIFSFNERGTVRSQSARELLKEIAKYEGLPFCIRWLAKRIPLFKVKLGLRELLNAGIIKSHPALPEIKKGMVSQAEHSFIIRKDDALMLTKAHNDI